jgi:hypothetical protein
MKEAYHRQITMQALQDCFSRRALQAILSGNLGQDVLRGQIGHSEYHFDNNDFAGSYAYLAQQRQVILTELAHGSEQALPLVAWQAFGRLTHGVQDFYAHSNYVRLWLAGHPQAAPEQIDPLEDAILNSPELISGRIYYPLEVLAFIPGLEALVKPLLPRDSHTWMNLDSPRQGALFDYAFVAAEKRTRAEFISLREQIQSHAGAQALDIFYGSDHRYGKDHRFDIR